MSAKFRPILAATLKEKDFPTLEFPIMISPKLDGIRVLIRDGQAVTRSLKPIRNIQVQKALGRSELNGLDGEVIVGDPCDPHAFRSTTTGVMAENAETDFKFYVFDNYLIEGGFMHRFHHLQDYLGKLDDPRLELVPHRTITNLNDLLVWERKFLKLNYEGTMIRSIDGIYKMGRSTLNQGILLKLKRGVLVEGEGVIVGFVEQLKNMNEKTINALGYSERSAHKENMLPQNTLGKLLIQCPEFDTPVKVGTGFDDEERADMWNNQSKYLGQTVKFEYMGYGAYDKPRQASYKGIRDPEDMS